MEQIDDSSHPTMYSPPPLCLGDRIQYKQAFGTVRYLGPLHDQGSSQWAGIEWDDPNRGKHSGIYNGQVYFTCVSNNASFVKLDKLGSGGRTSLLTAARIRHSDNSHNCHSDGATTTSTTVVGGAVVDLTDEGATVSAHLAAVKVLDVSKMGVSVVREDGLSQALSALRELRVAHSLLNSVDGLVDILEALPGLRLVDASHNVIGDSVNEGEQVTNAGADVDHEIHGHALEELVLNKCTTDWDTVDRVLSKLSGLRELRLHGCSLGPLPTTLSMAKRLQCVRVLDLDANRLTWADIGALGGLSQLRELYISANGLGDTPGPCDTATSFRALETLSVAENEVDGWELIGWMHGLASLRHVRVGGNPMSPREQDGGRDGYGWRLRTIARVGAVLRVDGSWVSKDERLLAERRYVQQEIVPDVTRVGLAEARKMHGRLDELVKKHEVDRNKSQRGGKTMAEGLIAVKIKAADGVKAQRRQVRRLVPRGMAVERVRGVAARALRVDRGVEFVLVDGGGEDNEVMDESRDVGFWSREGGAVEMVVRAPKWHELQ